MKAIDNIKAEQSLLASILINSGASLYICSKHGITQDSFSTPAHKAIFTAMQCTAARRHGADAVTVSQELKRSGKFGLLQDGGKYLNDIIDSLPTHTHAEAYAEDVRDAQNRRDMAIALHEALDALEGDTGKTGDVLGTLQNEIIRVTSESTIKIDKLGAGREEKIAQWREAKGHGFVGIPSSFRQLNKILGGWRKGVMAVLGAFRSEGKSTWCRGEALWLAQNGYKVALFSLEDPGDWAKAQIVGNYASENVFSLDTGNSTDDTINRMDKAWQEIADLPLWIIAHPMTMPDIIASAHLLKSRFDVDIIFIDHIQFIMPYQLPGTNRNNTIAAYSQQIVSLAKTLNISVIVASQLSRDAEKSNRKPRMSDLRDSGTIEQDARQIVLLYWDEKEHHHIMEVAKNNYGIARKEVNVRRVDGKQRFEEIAEIVATRFGENENELILADRGEIVECKWESFRK